MSVRGCICKRIFVVNFLVLVMNLILYIYNVHYSRFTFRRRIDDFSRVNNNTCNVTNQPNFTFQHRIDDSSKEKDYPCNITRQTVSCPHNWTALEARVFASPLNSKDRQLLDRMFRSFVETVEAANLTYFISGGTLIGSLRHHGLIPWDDDVDVIVKESDKDIVLKALSKLGPDFKLYEMKPLWRNYWKIFPSQGRRLRPGYEFRTPFIDIFLYLENKTHVWISSPEWQKTNVWPKELIFPLHKRPFGELLVAAPCNSLAVVNAVTNISMCQSRNWNHLVERSAGKVLRIPCDHLAHIYPFVKRSTETHGSSHLVKETLMIGDLETGEVMINSSC